MAETEFTVEEAVETAAIAKKLLVVLLRRLVPDGKELRIPVEEGMNSDGISSLELRVDPITREVVLRIPTH